jgi:hypothetical protein
MRYTGYGGKLMIFKGVRYSDLYNCYKTGENHHIFTLYQPLELQLENNLKFLQVKNRHKKRDAKHPFFKIRLAITNPLAQLALHQYQQDCEQF